MKKILNWLMRKRVIVVDVGRFGERMRWKEVQSALRGQGQGAVFRAVAQVVCCERERCQRAVEDKSNVPHGETAFEAGAAAAGTDLLGLLTALAEGKCEDRSLKEWFGNDE